MLTTTVENIWKHNSLMETIKALLFPKEVAIIHNVRATPFSSSHNGCKAAANYSDLWKACVRLARAWCRTGLSLIAIHHFARGGWCAQVQ